MTENTEKQILEIISLDRLDMPVSSMSGKFKRAKPKLARAVPLSSGEYFNGERVYARVETDDTLKARGMRYGIDKFSEEFPRHGKILNGFIEEQRALSETHLYFGMNAGSRLTANDYVDVLTGIGFSEAAAQKMLPGLLDTSYKLARKRDEERSILIG